MFGRRGFMGLLVGAAPVGQGNPAPGEVLFAYTNIEDTWTGPSGGFLLSEVAGYQLGFGSFGVEKGMIHTKKSGWTHTMDLKSFRRFEVAWKRYLKCSTLD